CMQFNHVAQPALQAGLDSELQGRYQFGTVRLKDHAQQATAEVRSVHALAGIGEQKLFDHVADVTVVTGGSGTATVVEMERKVDIHRPSTARSRERAFGSD